MSHNLVVLSLLLVLSSYCLLFVTAETTYYVSQTTGNDTFEGTEDSPFATLAKAVTTAVNQSVTDLEIKIYAGSYTVTSFIGFDAVYLNYQTDDTLTGPVKFLAADQLVGAGFTFTNVTSVTFEGTTSNNTVGFIFDGYFDVAITVSNKVTQAFVLYTSFTSSVYSAFETTSSATLNLLSIENSTFATNYPAVTVDGNSANETSQFQLLSSTFTNGGLFVENFGTGLIRDVVFNDFSSSQAVGRIADGKWVINSFTASNISTAPFIFLNVSLVNITSSSFTQVSAQIDGGALSFSNSNVEIHDSTFTNCTSLKNGGAIYQDAITLQVINTNFTNCDAADYGGAIYLESVNETLFENVRFVDSNATQAGGCIACCDTSSNCTDSTISLYKNSTTITGCTGKDITCQIVYTNSSSPFVTPFTVDTEAPPPSSTSTGAPWWVWLILALVLLAIILAVLAAGAYFVYQKKRSGYSTVE